MRCPHCGYNSFAHLEHCKKCGRELSRKTAEAGNLEGDSVAVADPATLENEDSSPTLAAGTTANPVEIGSSAADKRQSSLKVAGLENTAEDDFEPPLFAGFEFSPAPKPESHREEERAGHSFPPNSVNTLWTADHSATEPLFSGGSPAEAFPLGVTPIPRGRALIGRRFLASVLDIAAISAVWLLFYTWGYNLLWEGEVAFFAPLLYSPRARGGFYLLLILIALAYFILFHYINGQTPGKTLTGTRVVSSDGEPLTLTQVMLRTCGGFVSALCLGAGYAVIWWSQDARGWNDRVAETHVECVSAEDTPEA
ncbi:MAG: RDD family protein [Thermodesulfobacteriota bacterium]